MAPKKRSSDSKSAGKSSSLTNLEEQFIFYASYHNTRGNIFIHLLCIWNIAWTLIYLLQLYSPVFADTPAIVKENLSPDVRINAALLLTLFYCAVYLMMEPFIGLVGTLLWVAIYFGTCHLVFHGPQPMFFEVALGVHVGAWLLQFVGHAVFERRAPALLDSWQQAFITAPLFVLLEIAFFFGYRRDFYKRCMVKVEKNIAEFRAKGKGD